MKIFFALIVVMLVPLSGTSAQGLPDTIFLQKLILGLQGQRNQAQDAAAAYQAKVEVLQEDLARAKARIDELDKAKVPTPHNDVEKSPKEAMPHTPSE